MAVGDSGVYVAVWVAVGDTGVIVGSRVNVAVAVPVGVAEGVGE